MTTAMFAIDCRPIRPAAMIVKARALDRRKLGAEAVEIDGARIGERHYDQPRDRQFGDIDAEPDPRFEQCSVLLVVEHRHAADTGRRQRNRRRPLRRRVEIDLAARHDLDSHLAGDVGLPIMRRVENQRHRADGDAGEKAHDRDNDHHRIAGDRIRRDDRARPRLPCRRVAAPATGVGPAFGSARQS